MVSSENKRFLQIVSVVALLLIVADQLIKYAVRVYIGDGPNVEVFKWFYLCFVENNGMAFGITLGSKMFLSLFRLFAVVGLGYLIYDIIRRGFSRGFVWAWVLIFAGALGNLIDCIFYGVIFDGGDFFFGKVVDMFYFPIIKTTWPDWTPWAGHSLVFFRPVFNLADSFITTSVFYVILFKNKELTKYMSSFDDKEDQQNKKSE